MTNPTTTPPWIGGIDGCHSGWILALRQVGSAEIHLRLLSAIVAALTLPEKPALLAIDMPIGLADVAVSGGRACEVAARKLLPGKSSSVFSIPCRAALAATSYKQALALNRASGAGVGLSQQAFHIMPKLRELDALMTPKLQHRLVEAHPELAFARLNGKPVLSRKRQPDGRRERIRLLKRAGLVIRKSMLNDLPRGVAKDDALDAIALTVTAERVFLKQAIRLPTRPQRDAQGLRMEIWY